MRISYFVLNFYLSFMFHQMHRFPLVTLNALLSFNSLFCIPPRNRIRIRKIYSAHLQERKCFPYHLAAVDYKN